MAGGKKNNKRNYFSQSIKDGGEYFLNFKNAQDMLRDAPRIIKDLANENIDINKYYPYFQEPKVIDACIEYARIQLTEFDIISKSINFCLYNMNPGNLPDPIWTSLQNKYECKAIIFQHIYNDLKLFKINNDINRLYTLINKMNQSRYYINN